MLEYCQWSWHMHLFHFIVLQMTPTACWEGVSLVITFQWGTIGSAAERFSQTYKWRLRESDRHLNMLHSYILHLNSLLSDMFFFADKIGLSNLNLKRTSSSLILLHTFRTYGYLNFLFHSCDTEHFSYFAEKHLWLFNFLHITPSTNKCDSILCSVLYSEALNIPPEKEKHILRAGMLSFQMLELSLHHMPNISWDEKWNGLTRGLLNYFQHIHVKKTHHLHSDMSLFVELLYPSRQVSIRQTRCRSLFSLLTFVLLSGVQMDSHFPTILLEKPFYGKCLPYLITAHCSPCGYPVRFLLYPPVILPTSGCKEKEMNMNM